MNDSLIRMQFYSFWR